MAKTKKSATKKHGGKSRAKTKSIKISRNSFYALIALAVIAAIVLCALYFFTPIFDGGAVPTDVLEGDTLEVNFMDVGQGDCNIIRFPDGKNMIIDAGSDKKKSETQFNAMLKERIDDMNIDTFDYLVLTHTDLDHVGFMDEILKYYQVKNVYRPAFRSKSEEENEFALVSTEAYDDFVKAAESEPDCDIHLNVNEDYTIIGEGYEVNIFTPDKSKYTKIGNLSARDLNAVSVFCEVKYGGRSVFFTGDAEGADGNGAEADFMNKHTERFDCDVLKAGHHGSETSSSLEFLSRIDPEYVVVSANNVGNTFNHPRPEFLDRLKSYRDLVPDGDYNGIAHVYRTDKNGKIRLKIGTNGGMEFSTERSAA